MNCIVLVRPRDKLSLMSNNALWISRFSLSRERLNSFLARSLKKKKSQMTHWITLRQMSRSKMRKLLKQEKRRDEIAKMKMLK